MTDIQDALLARLSKQQMVDALRAEGFTEVTMKAPLSVLADYVRWCGSLRDLTLACVRKEDGAQAFFTETEWNAMSANAKAKYAKIGVRIRARKRSFIIAKDDVQDDTGRYDLPYGAYGRDLKGVQNYADISSGIYDIATGLTDTQAAVEQSAGQVAAGITGAPAAEVAWAYKAASEDTNQWYIPSLAELRLMAEFRVQINAFLSRMFASQNLTAGDWYWSSTERGSTSTWGVNMGIGGSIPHNRTTRYRVRPVCECLPAE